MYYAFRISSSIPSATEIPAACLNALCTEIEKFHYLVSIALVVCYPFHATGFLCASKKERYKKIMLTANINMEKS